MVKCFLVYYEHIFVYCNVAAVKISVLSLYCQFWTVLCHIHWKHLCWLLKRDSSSCFPVNIAKFLRTYLFIKHRRWLLLAFTTTFRNNWEDLSVIFFTVTYPSNRLREAGIRRSFSKKGVLKSLQISQERLCWSLFLT